jgi:hypothetical protein
MLCMSFLKVILINCQCIHIFYNTAPARIMRIDYMLLSYATGIFI